MHSFPFAWLGTYKQPSLLYFNNILEINWQAYVLFKENKREYNCLSDVKHIPWLPSSLVVWLLVQCICFISEVWVWVCACVCVCVCVCVYVGKRERENCKMNSSYLNLIADIRYFYISTGMFEIILSIKRENGLDFFNLERGCCISPPFFKDSCMTLFNNWVLIKQYFWATQVVPGYK